MLSVSIPITANAVIGWNGYLIEPQRSDTMALLDDFIDLQYLFCWLRDKGYGDEQLRYDLFDYFHGVEFMDDEDILKIKG